MTDQVTDSQNQDLTVNNQSLGWRAGLPDEYKEHEWAKGFTKVGDFYADAVKVKTESEALKTKLATAIFRPGENATKEEFATYYKSLGVPEKPDAYEFPKGEGVEHDEKMIGWARDVFHKANLTPEQAKLISGSWDQFVQTLSKEYSDAEIKTAEAKKAEQDKAIKEAEGSLKTEWGVNYDKEVELTKRGWNKFTNTDFDKFCEESGVGNKVPLIKFINKIGKAMGEDFSLPSQGLRQGADKPGQFSYPNSPKPPNNS